MYPSRYLRANQYATSGSSGFNFGAASVTTTDTTNWVTVANTTVRFTTNLAIIVIPFQLHLKHSAANARVGLALYLYDDPNGGTGTFVNPAVVGAPTGVLLASANEWYVFNPVGAYYLTGKIPGTHALYVAMRNYTAGTLTAIQGSIDFLVAFTQGIT